MTLEEQKTVDSLKGIDENVDISNMVEHNKSNLESLNNGVSIETSDRSNEGLDLNSKKTGMVMKEVDADNKMEGLESQLIVQTSQINQGLESNKNELTRKESGNSQKTTKSSIESEEDQSKQLQCYEEIRIKSENYSNEGEKEGVRHEKKEEDEDIKEAKVQNESKGHQQGPSLTTDNSSNSIEQEEAKGSETESEPESESDKKQDHEQLRTTVEDFLISNESKEVIQEYSDDEIEIDDNLSSFSEDSSSDSDSEDTENSSSDTDDENNKIDDIPDIDELGDEEGETINGPIVSKNEIIDEVAPSLPKDYKIPENSPLELVGEVTGLVEKSVLIKANISGEFRVLKDNSVLCFKDRTLLGPLFETFGRLQSPMYRVKFNSDEEFDKLKNKKGAQVYYVVPESQFLYTDTIKSLKGTDASNCHDEELPDDEQEFSDDERELAAKQAKKKKKKSKNTKEGTNEEKELRSKNRKRHHSNNNKDQQGKRFQAYGYAQNLQTPNAQPQFHQPYNPTIPQNHNLSNLQTVHQQMLQFQHLANNPQSSPYGVPFNQTHYQQTTIDHSIQPSPSQSSPYTNNTYSNSYFPQSNQLQYNPNTNQAQNNLQNYQPNYQPTNYNQYSQQVFSQQVPDQNNLPSNSQQSQLLQLQQLVFNHLNNQQQNSNAYQPPKNQ